MKKIKIRRYTFLLMALSVTLILGCEDKSIKPLVVPGFDQDNAFRYLEEQVAFGPRVPGTEAHTKCKTYLQDTLKAFGGQVNLQTFKHTIEKNRQEVQLTNIIASFYPEKGNRILLAAHWDCRPWADEDADSSKHNQGVDGANDAASGVAVLLEVARVLQKNPPAIGVDIAFFDGEDFGIHGNDATWAIGSKYFADHKSPNYAPFMGILLDMIGDADLHIKKEGYSRQYAPDIVNLVWGYAARLGLSAFVEENGAPVTDDHVALLKVGIPCIDLIDFEYPYWHTTEDTPDKCSASSLGQVGKLVLAVIYNPPI